MIRTENNKQRNGHMTAAVLYGSENLKIENVDIPTLAPDEALIRVKVALTCGTDLKVWKRGYHARMITPPAVFGHELSGIVETLGSDVNGGLKVGARVVPSNSAPCNVCMFCRKGQTNLCEDLLFNNGAYAEYIRIPGRIVRQNMLVIPEHVSFQDAAMVEPLACVLRGIHETGIQPGDTTVVIGCGPIGLKFIRILAGRGVHVIALGKRPNQIRAAEQSGARAAFIEARLAERRPLTASAAQATAGPLFLTPTTHYMQVIQISQNIVTKLGQNNLTINTISSRSRAPDSPLRSRAPYRLLDWYRCERRYRRRIRSEAD